MRFLLKFHFSAEQGNKSLKDPKFGQKMQDLLKDLKAEAAYFTTVCEERGGYIVMNMENNSDLAARVEPLCLWLNANVEVLPVMTAEDLGRAGPAIEAAVKKWS